MPRLVETYVERQELARRFRSSLAGHGKPVLSMKTPDGREISMIRCIDPKRMLYADNRNRFFFRRGNRGHIVLEKIGKLGETKQFANFFICDARTERLFPEKESLKGQTIRLQGLGLTYGYRSKHYTIIDDNAKQLPREGQKRRGVLPAILDFLKRNGAEKIVARPDPSLVEYYKSLGFDTSSFGLFDYEIELKKWRLLE
jgi:hypothetical protein